LKVRECIPPKLPSFCNLKSNQTKLVFGRPLLHRRAHSAPREPNSVLVYAENMSLFLPLAHDIFCNLIMYADRFFVFSMQSFLASVLRNSSLLVSLMKVKKIGHRSIFIEV